MCCSCSSGALAPAPIFLAPATHDHTVDAKPSAPNLWCVPLVPQKNSIPPPPLVVAKIKQPPDEQQTKKKDAAGKAAVAAASSGAPALKEGTSYLYAKKNTSLHVIHKTRIWEKTGAEAGWRFDIKLVATCFGVGDLIERLVDRVDKEAEREKYKGWAVTEVVEKGDGGWSKGSTITFGSDKAKGSLAAFGWSEKRGDTLPPVWIVLHKN